METSKITGNNTISTSQDGFGARVAIQGDTLLVDAYGTDATPLGDVGSIYFFEYDGVNWVQMQEISASDQSNAADLGREGLIIDGDTFIATSKTDRATLGGSAYIFTRPPGGLWSQQAKITPPVAEAQSYFGYSATIEGDTAVIGAILEDSPMNGGAAYVYTRSGTTWTFQQKLKGNDVTADDLFGTGVAISGNTIVVGASGRDTGRGTAYFFNYNGTAWEQHSQVTPTGLNIYAGFGEELDIDGDYAVIGAHTKHSTFQRTGSAYVYERNATGHWNEVTELMSSDPMFNDFLANAVAIEGDTIIVGVRGDDVMSVTDAGSAFIFKRNSTGYWEETDMIVSSMISMSAMFANSVAISLPRYAVGEPVTNYAYIFE